MNNYCERPAGSITTSETAVSRKRRWRWASTARRCGFACWAWDYDNDGWLDIFAASFDRDLTSIVKGMIGEPHDLGYRQAFPELSRRTV